MTVVIFDREDFELNLTSLSISDEYQTETYFFTRQGYKAVMHNVGVRDINLTVDKPPQNFIDFYTQWRTNIYRNRNTSAKTLTVVGAVEPTNVILKNISFSAYRLAPEAGWVLNLSLMVTP